MVRTGAQSYVKYGYESTYGGSATCDKKFGLRDSLGSWSLTHNRIDLPALNQLTYESYAYGTQAGEISVDFALNNPWIFGAFFGEPSTTGSSNPYTHTYPHASNGINKQPRSFQVEVGFNAADTSNSDIVRTLKGCIASTLGITTSIGQTVDCSLSASYGKEDAPATTFGSAPSEPTLDHKAFTFAHAQLKYGGSVVAQVQDLNLQINQTPTLLYGLNSNQAVDAYRQIFEIDWEGSKATIEYEDDLTFGELESVINNCVDLSDVTKPKVNIPNYRQTILLKVIRSAPFEVGSAAALRNMKASVAKQIIAGVMVDYPLAKFLEDWMVTFMGSTTENEQQPQSTTSVQATSDGIKKRQTGNQSDSSKTS